MKHVGVVLLLAMSLAVAAACLGGDEDASPTIAPPPDTATGTATATSSETATATTTPPSTPSSDPTTPGATATTPDVTATGTATPSPTETGTPPPTIVPTLDEGKLDMKVLTYSHPVTPGENAFVTLVSDEADWCVAELDYSKAPAGPERLQRKDISEVGQVDWLFRIQDSEPQQITVTAECQGSGKRGVRQVTIEIVAPAAQ